MEEIQAVRGTEDVWGEQAQLYKWIENVFMDKVRQLGYQEIRTPIIEYTELFARAIGSYTDIVSKEMYTFSDRHERSISLRPEGTASVVRACLEHRLYKQPGTLRFYYIGPMFRYERPQAGRLRQHTQLGVENIGCSSYLMDVEVIYLAHQILAALTLTGLRIYLNSVGCPECRGDYRAQLVNWLRERSDRLCPDCRERVERNPLRVFDCKVPACGRTLESAPMITDHLCSYCYQHFSAVQAGLSVLELDYRVDKRLVRGLDYYTRTVFEIKSAHLGAQDTVCGGGRYDMLFRDIGGEEVPATGFSMGLERLAILISKHGWQVPKMGTRLYLATVGDKARPYGLKVLQHLLKGKLSLIYEAQERGFSWHIKQADRLGVDYVLFIGDDEADKKLVSIKRLADGRQVQIDLEHLPTDQENWEKLFDFMLPGKEV